MIFENGGEEGFVGQMVEESQRFTTRCKYVILIIFHLFYVFKMTISYKMVHLDVRKDVICDYNCRKPPKTLRMSFYFVNSYV